MRISQERYGRSSVQKEISVVMKKAYCGFERLEKEHEERMNVLLDGIRRERMSTQPA